MNEKRMQQLDRTFHQQLTELRSRINTVDEDFRPILADAADQAEQQHVRMQRNCRRIADMVADLGLIVERTRFECAIARQTS